MGQSSSQVQKEEDIDQALTDRSTPFSSIAEEEITPEAKIESNTFTQIPTHPATRPTTHQQPDPFLTPRPKRRFSFEIRVPSPADLKMARKSDAPMSEPAKPAKRKRIWEDNDDEATPPPSAQRVKIKDRLSITQLLNDKEGSENGAYSKESTPSRTPSGKSKRTNRGKHLPPGFRPGHVSSTNAKRTGLFSPEEIETLEQYKLWFCNYYHITADVFDASIQSVQSSKDGIFLQDKPPIESRSFWTDIYGQIPDRDKKSISRFCRRHFSNAYKPHQWTTADDDELERLHSMHGSKWAMIARDMERTYDDVVQRWKNKVEHRHTMKTGPWDDDEIDKLVEKIQDTRKAHLESGKTEEEIGKDIYELPEELIAWGRISERFEHTRSRQQVADKWRKIKRIVLERRQDGYEDAVWEPSLQPRGGKKSKYRPLPVVREKQEFASNEMVDSSDEDEDQNEAQNQKKEENGGKKQSAKANGTAQPEVDESANESSDSSSEDDSSDDSSADEESNAAENSGGDGEDDVAEESAGEETPVPKTNGYHAASDNESVVPESQIEESQAEESEVEESQAEESEASSSRSPSPEAETNGNTAASGRQPSEELGLDPVSAPEAPEAPEAAEADKDTQASEEEDSENADKQDIELPTTPSQLKPAPSPAKLTISPFVKQEEEHHSPLRNDSGGSDSESDDDDRSSSDSRSRSNNDKSDDESEDELSPEEIKQKTSKFKGESDDD